MKTWDEYFAQICSLTASKSEDQSTKCGCVIVTATNEIVSTGYNGFARGVKNTEARNERPLKYSYFEHSERNAIYNCARNGVATLGCKLYVTGVPCVDCARAIIQAGIKEVIMLTGQHDASFSERWAESMKVSKEMLAEANVIVREYTLGDNDNGKEG